MSETEATVKSLRRTGRYFIAVAVLLGLGLLYNGYRTFDLSKDTKQDIRAASLEACERGNESRVARIVNYRRDIDGLQADIRFVAQFTPVLPADGPLRDWSRSKHRAITYKQQAIDAEIDAIARYATSPGSPVIDCEAAYPPL
jgi:hypothetical protein